MSTAAFIIGMLILGLCVIVAAVLLSGAISGAASALKESAPQTMQQPTLTFLTEYDAADYLGISLNELDYIRSEGLLDGAFIAVTSLEQTGEESYVDYEDGIEVSKTRPVMSNVTRFLFNRQLLDEKMVDAIKDGKHINPFRAKAQEKKQGGKKNKQDKEISKEKKNKQPIIQLFDEEENEVPEAEENKVEKVSVDDIIAGDTDSKKEEGKAEEVVKPAPAGPPMPMGPIGDDDEEGSEDDVVDIMARINSAKQGERRPENSGKNGSRPNNNGHRPNGGRPNNGSRPNNGHRPNGSRPNNGSHQ